MRRLVTISGNVIGEVNIYKYLGSFVQKDEVFGVNVKHRINCGWIK
jgi:hypothetical protein